MSQQQNSWIDRNWQIFLILFGITFAILCGNFK